MGLSEIVGSLAACCSTVIYVQQVYKTWKIKSAKSVSVGMFIISTITTLSWITYGIMTGRWPIYVSNIVGFILSVTQIALKMKYDRAGKK